MQEIAQDGISCRMIGMSTNARVTCVLTGHITTYQSALRCMSNNTREQEPLSYQAEKCRVVVEATKGCQP